MILSASRDGVAWFSPFALLDSGDAAACVIRAAFDPLLLFPLLFLFQDVVDCLNDPFALVGLAVNDDLMNSLFDARDVDRVLLREPIVPTAVPNTQEVGVFLKCVGARQRTTGPSIAC